MLGTVKRADIEVIPRALIRMKRAAGRPKDVADVAGLELLFGNETT
jgi:hypothetical protein